MTNKITEAELNEYERLYSAKYNVAPPVIACTSSENYNHPVVDVLIAEIRRLREENNKLLESIQGLQIQNTELKYNKSCLDDYDKAHALIEELLPETKEMWMVEQTKAICDEIVRLREALQEAKERG